MPGTACTRDCCVTLLLWAGRTMGHSVAVGIAYIWPMPCEMKQPKPYKHMATRSLLHNTHLPLAESHTTHSQTNLHTSGVKAHWATLYEVSALTVDSHTSLCVHSHPAIKERKRKGSID